MGRAYAAIVLIVVGACGNEAATVDALEEHWSWTFRDADGNDVGCPPGVTTVELALWTNPDGLGDGCGRPNPMVKRVETFPCATGDAIFTSGGLPRMDFKLDDGRVYARMFPNLSGHVDVLAPRGFVALSWSFYNQTTMLPAQCDPGQLVTSSWLGPHERFPCKQGAPTMTVLPGQPIGDTKFDVWLTGIYESCGNVFQNQTLSLTVLPDQTIDRSVQFASAF